MIIPLVLIFMCLGFSVAESIVERSLRKAFQRAALSFPLGLVFSVVFMFAGGIVYRIGMDFCAAMGIDIRTIDAYRNPAVWIARSFAWMVFASAAGRPDRQAAGFGPDRSCQPGRREARHQSLRQRLVAPHPGDEDRKPQTGFGQIWF